MKIKFFSLIVLISMNIFIAITQDSITKDQKSEIIKKGWNFGVLPALAYESDVGFRYGFILNLFNFGDGSIYPDYKHSIYVEWSRTTKGNGINMITYDSKYLIPGIRLSLEASLYTEKALDFYGFNGYKSIYNYEFENEKSENYISRVFYKLDRRLGKLRSDFYGKFGNNLKWHSGIEFFDISINTVDIENLNKGKSPSEQLPDTSLLYDKYIEWKIIPEDQIKGGKTSLLKFGLIYDTRNNEPNPTKGLWTELLLLISQKPLSNYSYIRYCFTHRQYITILKNLSLAYRFSYQGKLLGTMPFYMLPFVYNTAPNFTRDGLGGSKTIRGVLRNRIVGEDFIYGNIEYRWKFYKTVILKQNFYITYSIFTDFGMITKDYKLNLSNVPQIEKEKYFNGKVNLHISYGNGLHFVMNENFIVAIDYGRALKKQDGKDGLYINLNFLF